MNVGLIQAALFHVIVIASLGAGKRISAFFSFTRMKMARKFMLLLVRFPTRRHESYTYIKKHTFPIYIYVSMYMYDTLIRYLATHRRGTFSHIKTLR